MEQTDETVKVENPTRDVLVKIAKGLLLTLLISFSWAGQTQFTKSSFQDASGFNAPFFLVWFSTLWMILCYPVNLIAVLFWRKCFRKNLDLDSNNEEIELTTQSDTSFRAVLKQKWQEDICVLTNSVQLNFRSFAIILVFTCLWIGCNYAASKSLVYIAPAEFSVIFSCNSAMVFILAFLILRDSLTLQKFLSIALSVGGVVCVSYVEGLKGFTVLGVVLSVVSAFLAAMYKVCFKKIVGDANFGQVNLFMTFLGLCNAVLFWPVMLALALTHVEHIHPATAPWAFIVGVSILGFLFNLMINVGIAATYPLFVSIGMFMGIPVNTLIDVLARHIAYGSTLQIVGILLIVASFILILMPIDKWIPPCGKGLSRPAQSGSYDVVDGGNGGIDSQIPELDQSVGKTSV